MARFKRKSKKSRKAKRSAAKAARVRTVTRKVYVKAKRAKRKFKRVARYRSHSAGIALGYAVERFIDARHRLRREQIFGIEYRILIKRNRLVEFYMLVFYD